MTSDVMITLSIVGGVLVLAMVIAVALITINSMDHEAVKKREERDEMLRLTDPDAWKLLQERRKEEARARYSGRW